MGEAAPTIIPTQKAQNAASDVVQLAQAIVSAGGGGKGGLGQILAVLAIVIAVGWGVVHEFQSATERRLSAVEQRQRNFAKALKLSIDTQAERGDWRDEVLELLVQRVAPDARMPSRPSARSESRQIDELLETP